MKTLQLCRCQIYDGGSGGGGGGGGGGTKSPMVAFVFFVKKKLLDVHSTHSIIFHMFRKM